MADNEDSRSRRGYLRAVLGTGVVSGLAGCGALTGGETTDTTEEQAATDTGTSTTTTASGATENGTATEDAGDTETATDPPASFPVLSSAEPTYRRWQPGTGDLAGTLTAAHNIGRYRDKRAALPAAEYESGTSWAMFGGYVGVEYEELGGVLIGLTAPGPILTGSFARADVESRLRAMPYEQYTSRDGVTYYRWDGGSSSRFVGVSGAGVIHGAGRRDADDPAAQFADRCVPFFETARGDRPALHEENDQYRQYTDAIGWPLVASASLPRPLDGPGSAGGLHPVGDVVSESVAASLRMGYGVYLADGSLVSRYWLRTSDDASVSTEEALAAYRDGEARSGLANEGESVAVRRDGRVVDVGVLDPVQQAGGGVDPVPVALDVAREGRTVTVEHVAGAALPLSRVTVLAGADPVGSLGDGTLSPGDSVSVEVPEGTERVRLLYSTPNSEGRTVIAEAE